MEPLHDDEADTGSEVVLDLLRSQAPHLAARSLARISGTAGNTGSDNVLYRLGTELVVRLPRPPSAATSLRTETRLLPHLAGRLPSRTGPPRFRERALPPPLGGAAMVARTGRLGRSGNA